MDSAQLVTARGVSGLNLDGNVYTGGEIELLQLIHGAGGRIHDVEETFVGADFKLLGRLFVNVNGTVHREFFDPGREGHGAGDAGSGSFGGVHDLRNTTVESAEVIGPEADADALVLHGSGMEKIKGLDPTATAAAAGFDDLFNDVVGNGFTVTGLHAVGSTTGGEGADCSGITEHLG